ncbi:hypothetical protein HYQ46_001712 [Verticillium longisporum]|nr:hypothetical protein HYQ46_001712 [Verticillium longisporum]
MYRRVLHQGEQLPQLSRHRLQFHNGRSAAQYVDSDFKESMIGSATCLYMVKGNVSPAAFATQNLREKMLCW